MWWRARQVKGMNQQATWWQYHKGRGLGLEGTAPAHTEQTLPRHQPEQSREDSEVFRRYVQQMRQGTGPQSYGGWPEIVIFAQLEGVHIGVYTREKTARKSPLYKVREAGLPTATKKVML